MAAAACLARNRPRSSGSSLSRAPAAVDRPRGAEAASQAGAWCEEGSSVTAADVDADAAGVSTGALAGGASRSGASGW